MKILKWLFGKQRICSRCGSLKRKEDILCRNCTIASYEVTTAQYSDAAKINSEINNTTQGSSPTMRLRNKEHQMPKMEDLRLTAREISQGNYMSAKELLENAETYKNQRDYHQAREVYNQIYDDYPDSPEASIALAEINKLKKYLDVPSFAAFNAYCLFGLTIIGLAILGLSDWPHYRVFRAIDKPYLAFVYVGPYIMSIAIWLLLRNAYQSPPDEMILLATFSLGLYVAGWIHGNIVLSRVSQAKTSNGKSEELEATVIKETATAPQRIHARLIRTGKHFTLYISTIDAQGSPYVEERIFDTRDAVDAYLRKNTVFVIGDFKSKHNLNSEEASVAWKE